VQYIRDRSKPEQWRHVAGELNPADEASRGLTVTELLASVARNRADPPTTQSRPRSQRP
jgi:hypothetical protein